MTASVLKQDQITKYASFGTFYVLGSWTEADFTLVKWLFHNEILPKKVLLSTFKDYNYVADLNGYTHDVF